jgi:hopanoid biosynthesis associated protein HpnK
VSGCRLIVHADDFGLAQPVNDGIVEAHRRGIVTSTSIMAPGPAFDHAVELARATPTLDVGVHLTLTEEQPVSDPGRVPTLLGADGRLPTHATSFLRQRLAGRLALDEIRLELDAQIARVVERGVRVSHLDGHQHVHMMPGVRAIVGELAAKYAIPAVRHPREAVRAWMLGERGSTGRLLQQLALNAFCAAADTAGAARPDHFVGFFHGGRLSKANLMRILATLPRSGTCELMCHPGHADTSGRYAHWGYRWQDEFDALTDPAVTRWLREHHVELVSYASLARA